MASLDACSLSPPSSRLRMQKNNNKAFDTRLCILCSIRVKITKPRETGYCIALKSLQTHEHLLSMIQSKSIPLDKARWCINCSRQFYNTNKVTLQKCTGFPLFHFFLLGYEV